MALLPEGVTFEQGACLGITAHRAVHDINEALEAGWEGLELAERFPLEEIARAHEAVEHPTKAGRVVVTL